MPFSVTRCQRRDTASGAIRTPRACNCVYDFGGQERAKGVCVCICVCACTRVRGWCALHDTSRQTPNMNCTTPSAATPLNRRARTDCDDVAACADVRGVDGVDDDVPRVVRVRVLGIASKRQSAGADGVVHGVRQSRPQPRHQLQSCRHKQGRARHVKPSRPTPPAYQHVHQRLAHQTNFQRATTVSTRGTLGHARFELETSSQHTRTTLLYCDRYW